MEWLEGTSNLQGRRYSFKPPEWSNWKGRLCEELAMDYIREIFIPELKEKEKWQHVLVTKQFIIFQKINNEVYIDKEQAKMDFFLHGLYPSKRLLRKLIEINRILSLESCIPDGILAKLNNTGEMERLSNTISRSYLPPEIRKKDVIDLPIVDGEIEILEIKSKKSPLRAKQKLVYNALIMKGFPLRLFKVHMISFDQNRFAIREKRIDELYST